MTLRDLGVHRLRDLGRPEHVWQLVHPALPASSRALRSLDAYPSQPAGAAHPAGRSSRRDRRTPRSLSEERLVTLVGSAGVGKTRLALAVVSGPAGPSIGAACGGWSWRRCPIRTPSVAPRSPHSARIRLPARRWSISSPSSSATTRAWSSWTTVSTSSHRAPGSWPSCCRPGCGVGAGDEPRTARRPRRGRLAGAVAALPRPGPGRFGPGVVAVRRGAAVLGSRPSGPTLLHGGRSQRSRHRPDLSPARRHPAGHRAGRRPLPADVGGTNRRRPG